MAKREDFLYIVQTGILANNINLARHQDATPEDVAVFSASATLGLMNDVMYAADRIPDDMTALDAAHDFCDFFFSNFRRLEEAASGERMTVPHWCARY